MAEQKSGLSRLLRALTSLPGRILITALLLGLVAASIDWGELTDALEQARWEYALLAIGLGVVSIVISGIRWRFYLDALELGVSPMQAQRAYFVGSFSNSALPTGFGGDAVRTWLVGRTGVRLARSATSVLFDRLSSLACLVALAWLGVLFYSDEIPGNQIGLLAALTGAGIVAVVALVLLLRRQGLGRFLPEALRPWAREIAQALRTILLNPRLQATTFGLGLLSQAAIVAVVWALAETLTLDLSPAYLAVVSALVVVATLLPVSIAGFGIREGTYVALLGAVGVASADAALISVMSVPTMALASLPGGIALLRGSVSVEPPPAADELEAVPELGEHGAGVADDRVA